MPRASMIDLTAVGKHYPGGPRREDVHALRDVVLSIPSGRVTAVVGPNGAGKSTLFGLVLGFLRPTSGHIRVDGLEPRRYVRARGASYLAEHFAVPDGWTVRLALRSLARLDGLRGEAAARRADECLSRFGLESHAGKRVRALSRGLLQRLGLAQADLGRHELVVLDEPAQGLDPLWRIRLREWIAGLAAEGRTVLLASHDLAEIERVAQSAVLLHDGTVRETLPLHAAGGGAAARYRLVVRSGEALVAAAFPGAIAAEPPGHGANGRSAFDVVAASEAELSDRVGALIAAGAVVVGLTPAGGRLEERVRRTLDTP